MAGNRCNSCGKMASLEYDEPEINSSEITAGRITASLRLALTTSCCNDEVKDWEAEFDFEPDHLAAHLEAAREAGEVDAGDELLGHDLEIANEVAEASDDYETKDKKGRPIKARYQKHRYDITYSGQVVCECGVVFDFSETESEYGSGFNEL